jgi:hypothetical protein
MRRDYYWRSCCPWTWKQFLFIFLVMVWWIQIIFGIQMYHEGMQVFLIFLFFFWKGSWLHFHNLQLPQNCWNDFSESW